MTHQVLIGAEPLDSNKVMQWARCDQTFFDLCPQARKRIAHFRSLVEEAIASGKTIYGINTGFGLLSDVSIDLQQLDQLQLNLIRSHAAGRGSLLSPDLVRAMMIIKAHSLSFGNSGVRPEVIEQILSFLNLQILPQIPEQGSVGASGDLAPLAHMTLALIGEGSVDFQGKTWLAAELLPGLGIKPLSLKAKEGLSLINGTQFMAALGAKALVQAQAISLSADLALALSIDAFRGTTKAFDPRIHELRGQRGQKTSAERLCKIFGQPDAIQQSHHQCGKVQDPYSFRCAPQVHGASLDAIDYVADVVNRELNAVTDNPLVFEDGDVISAGNFHGQPIAMALDVLAIALSEFGSISERRIEKLTDPNMSGLPAFLVSSSGLNSGYMIYHVTAAALASENKGLCHPAVVDSIPTSAAKEDHVSMGPIAARKVLKVCENVAHILAVELAAASQGIDLLAPLKPNQCLQKLHDKVREWIPYLENDDFIANGLDLLGQQLLDGQLLAVLDEA